MSLPADVIDMHPVASGIREKVWQLEALMKKYEQLDLPVKHYFSKGVYARELFIPKDTILTGHIHKYEQLNILSKGDISVLTEEGVKRVQAPFAIVSPPGTKRIAYAHEDCVWTTIHGTDLKDVEEIEKVFICKSDVEYLEFVAMLENKS